MEPDTLAQVALPASDRWRVPEVVASLWAHSDVEAHLCRSALALFLLGDPSAVLELIPPPDPDHPPHPATGAGVGVLSPVRRLRALDHYLHPPRQEEAR